MAWIDTYLSLTIPLVDTQLLVCIPEWSVLVYLGRQNMPHKSHLALGLASGAG